MANVINQYRCGGENLNDSQPVFAQIMEIVENDIINGVYQMNDIIISTTQISKLYSVNPTTAVKAISRLAEDGILYKRPGIGMCVAEGAKQKILERRKTAFLGTTIDSFLSEANRLGISMEELITLIKKRGENHD
jgi:DNA-binding transcriptional regulator YhcF (GntR family)